MKYTDSNITFNNVNNPSVALGGNASANKYDVGFLDLMNPDYILPSDKKGGSVVNAIDIDWNGADLNGEKINTTGQVLAKLAAHENAIKELDGSGPEIKFPATIVTATTDIQTVEPTITSGSINTIYSLPFAVNDDSVEDSRSVITVERMSKAKYSIVAWPKSFGHCCIPSNWKQQIYETSYNNEEYYAIVSATKSVAFTPLVFNK